MPLPRTALLAAFGGVGILVAAARLHLSAEGMVQTAANAVTPAGLGGSALMVRLHARTGLTGDEAVAAVTLRALASGVAGVIVASLAAATLGLEGPHLPGGDLAPLIVAVLAVGGVA